MYFRLQTLDFITPTNSGFKIIFIEVCMVFIYLFYLFIIIAKHGVGIHKYMNEYIIIISSLSSRCLGRTSNGTAMLEHLPHQGQVESPIQTRSGLGLRLIVTCGQTRSQSHQMLPSFYPPAPVALHS